MPSPVILSVESAVKRFGAVTAVGGVSLEVGRGEIVALLGPNGAGKTTLIRMLMGIIRPDAGTVRFRLDGADAVPPPHALGYLPEDRGLYQDVPVGRTVAYFGVLRGMRPTAARDAAKEWLVRFGLGDRAGEPLKALSKGNQQKVQVIAAIVHGPRFVVLDEPFSGLDPVNQDILVALIRELRDRGATVLFSAHQMQLVERLADRIVLMSAGREVLRGTIAELRERWKAGSRLVLRVAEHQDAAFLAAHPAVEQLEQRDGEIRLRTRADASLSDLLSAAASRLTILDVHSERATLHDIYVQTVAGGTSSGDETP